MKAIEERTRPKGFNSKVWLELYKEAKSNKAWALDIIKTKPEWSQNASQVSIEMLGKYLTLGSWQLAKQSYEYLEMRAFGFTFIGPLDRSARKRWEEITGRKIKSGGWCYDHTTNTTAATKVNKIWCHWLTNKPIEQKRGAR